MMKNFKYLFLILLFYLPLVSLQRCKIFAASESLVINEEGLVPYNIPVYRITKNDILNLNIVTTPKGDAAQFYSSYNTSGGVGAGTNPLQWEGASNGRYRRKYQFLF
jgi:polysaccharide export outer membrane protein